MKTSQKEGVSDRPPTPMSCAGLRRRSSTAAVDVSSAHLDAVQAGSDTRAAPVPLPCACGADEVGSTSKRVTNGFLSHRPSSLRAAYDLDILVNCCRTEDVDGLRVRSANGRVMIAPGPAATRNPATWRLATRREGRRAADRPLDENRPVLKPHIAVIGSGEATEVEASLAAGSACFSPMRALS
jgi:hypothetical protein